MKKWLSILILFTTGFCVNAQQDKMTVLDTDLDGRISIEEAAADAELAAIFTELDTNKDGFLTPSELAEK